MAKVSLITVLQLGGGMEERGEGWEIWSSGLKT